MFIFFRHLSSEGRGHPLFPGVLQARPRDHDKKETRVVWEGLPRHTALSGREGQDREVADRAMGGYLPGKAIFGGEEKGGGLKKA